MSHLVVNPAHVSKLAHKQDDVADQIGSATRVTNGIGHDVWVAHGVASAYSNRAVDKAESARRAAGEALQAAAKGLAANLRTAAAAYHRTDQHHAGKLDDQLR
ncbi:ESX-1 secretion-associated protein [Mycobacterium shinjukuense]|uniref:Uncharacterized protein n=1 Tax=Mycobacterium shinjukuense TaxID=398694 RepID=A0A7I7MSH5_9MYCO|nr:ESX-1 secretion-associated protein [Mycobacterium shinjukuense]MCV6985449.1 ESX-1 secretion-associated protein [Mycobacterium shinjukuense]ORB61528.1 hypothetical protein BST45_19900 [Mycobacterium shinjukuense]BBX75181.1 hypothetical protein MSHI_30870 [Mycobacterium shinjukuense]